ncbi:MerR family transcriptional regulator [Actinoplanes sp. NPDC048796]|uniref:MerR family transcriptional regulator n=1 Tax=Actinoplanes sp. NPDC048796 TaxID=3155640 RepID=UPI00340218FF
MLSIKEFSQMAQLSAPTLRYYHAEGLLVPARVDERTGYRSYTFGQVEDAMLVTVLRQAGLGVERVRRVLGKPGAALALLREHSARVQRRRPEEDEAIQTARDLLEAQPRPRRRRVPAMTVVSRPAPATPVGPGRQEWDVTEAILTAATEKLTKTVELYGATPTGTPWRILAPGTASAREGSFWWVQIEVLGDPVTMAALASAAEVRECGAGDELSITMPGRHSMAKYCTAISRLLAHPIDGSYLDIAQLRHVVLEDSAEFSAPIRGATSPL